LYSTDTMPGATEIALLFLKPDATIEDASSPAGQQLRKVLDFVAAQKGFQQLYYGRQLEDPRLLILTIDWDDVSDHHAFMKSESYKDFFAVLAPLFDFETNPPHLFHVNYASHPPNGPREAPVTEFACFALPAGASNEQKSALEDAVLNLAVTVSRTSTMTSFATGWVLEDLDHEKGTDGKAIGFSALLGWPSQEDHNKARERPEFLEAAGPVRGMALPPTPGYTGIGFFHAKLTKA